MGPVHRGKLYTLYGVLVAEFNMKVAIRVNMMFPLLSPVRVDVYIRE